MANRLPSSSLKIIRFRGETLAYVSVILVSLTLLAFLGYLNFTILVGGLMIILISTRLAQAQQLGSSLQVTEHQLPNIYKITQHLTEVLKLPRTPRVHIAQNPTLNAYTMGFGNNYTIVVHSGIIEGLSDDEISVVIAHEMGHILFKHTQLLSIISPLGNQLPFSNYLFGFWERKSEYTCDRVALIATGDKESVVRTLVKISSGVKAGNQVDLEQLTFQLQGIRSGIIGKLGELEGTHPYLVHRVWEINKFDFKYKNSFCRVCGNINIEAAEFCGYCGKKL